MKSSIFKPNFLCTSFFANFGIPANPIKDIKRLSKYASVIILSLVELLAGIFAFGLNYGWLDDICAYLSVQGYLVRVPADGDFGHLLHYHWGTFYETLFRLWPGFDWFAAGHLLIISLAVLNINYLLCKFTAKVSGKKWLFPVFSILFYTAFLAESVSMMNGTRISTLVVGSAMLVIMTLMKRDFSSIKYMLLVEILVLIMGYHMRFPVAQIMLVFSGLIVFFYVYNFNSKKAFTILASICTFLLIFTMVHRSTLNSEELKWQKGNRQVLNLLDGFNGLHHFEIEDETLQVQRLALTHWWMGDPELLSEEFLRQFGPTHPFTIDNVKNWRTRFNEEVMKARYAYQPEYHGSLNWYYKNMFLIGLILISVLLLLLRFGSSTSRKWKLLLGLTVFLFLGGLLGLTVFFKMEDRILHPLLTILFLGCLVHLTDVMQIENKTKMNFRVVSLIALLIIPFSITRSISNHAIGSSMTGEYAAKKELFSRMDEHFGDQLILFDLFTYTTYPAKPFHVYDLQHEAARLSYTEIWNALSTEHFNNLQNICPEVKSIDFFKCLASKDEDVIFFYRKERVEMLEKYFEVVYGERFRFTKLDFDSQIQYSYMWFPMDLEFYTIELLE